MSNFQGNNLISGWTLDIFLKVELTGFTDELVVMRRKRVKELYNFCPKK